MGLNQGEVPRIEGVRGMSKAKRKFKRMHKGNLEGPRVESFLKDGSLITKVSYKGDHALAEGSFINASNCDLRLLDRDIMRAFKDNPWSDVDDLIDIASDVRFFTLATVEDLWGDK